MNVFACIIFAIGAAIPTAEALQKEEIEAQLPPLTAKWFVYRGLAGPHSGDKETAWKAFETSRATFKDTKFVYGITSTKTLKNNGKFLTLYNTTAAESLGDGKGFEVVKPIHVLNTSDLTPSVKDTDIFEYAKDQAKRIFGDYDKDKVVIVSQGFQGPALTIEGDKATVNRYVSQEDFVFIMMAQADSS